MTTDSPSEMLTDSRATAAGASDPNPAPPFFPVSVAKMAILSFVTFNLYPVYWFYQNWRLVKMREGSDILPFWRAIFGYFFCHEFFRRVRDARKETGATSNLPIGLLTTGWIITCVTWRLPDPYGLVALASPVWLLPVQKAAIEVNIAVAPNHDMNSSFTWANWVTVAIGGILLSFALLGAFIPEP